MPHWFDGHWYIIIVKSHSEQSMACGCDLNLKQPVAMGKEKPAVIAS